MGKGIKTQKRIFLSLALRADLIQLAFVCDSLKRSVIYTLGKGIYRENFHVIEQ